MKVLSDISKANVLCGLLYERVAGIFLQEIALIKIFISTCWNCFLSHK